MNILWFTWKDKKNPYAGGAELLNEEHAKRLVKDGHKVIFLVAGFVGGDATEVASGYKIVRLGNKWTVYWRAYRYYKKNLKKWPDLIIEEINTVPFFTQFYAKQKKILYIYQLCREIWFYEIFFPFNLIGYLLEPLYLFILRKNKVLTESQSTKDDLQKYGFKENQIDIVPVGVDIKPVENLDKTKKYTDFTVLSLGAIRSMKQTHDQIKAFEIAKKSIPNLKFIIAGSSVGKYGKMLLEKIENNHYKKDIKYMGRISVLKKKELMRKSHVILVTSVKEGWGLTVTEAASQGTPSIVYNVDGLRDSVKNNITGLSCQQNDDKNLAQNIVKLYADKRLYSRLRTNAWKSSMVTFDAAYKKFIDSLNL